LRAFPRPVRREAGQALYAAQQGETDPAAKVLRGFGGASVLEVIAQHRGDTWRAVYTVRYAEAVYVLHAFQKKAKRGIATPKADMDLIRQRLSEAERLHRQAQNWVRQTRMTTKRTLRSRRAGAKALRVEESSGNVFADLGLPNPEQELLKAQLTLRIYRLIKQRGITQTEAGRVLGIKQPHVSALMRNRAGSFSVERLMDFLAALGQDVEISVRPTRRQHGVVSVLAWLQLVLSPSNSGFLVAALLGMTTL
jgi:phage-related protein/predicted XRE-type DNA-binding protein